MAASHRLLHLGLTLWPTGTHPAGWRYAGSKAGDAFDIALLQRMAQRAQLAKLDYVFLRDRPPAEEHSERHGSRTNGRLEPFTVAGSLAAVTSQIGLVVAGSPAAYDPFTLARLTASLDHLSDGRAAWSIPIGEPDAADLAYERIDEFVDVVTGLWDCWDDDAFIRNVATGRFIDPSKVHTLNHKGTYFSVAGPFNVARPPQGHVVIFHRAQNSPRSRTFAARNADVIVAPAQTIEAARASYADFKNRVRAHGRAENDIVILQECTPIVAETTEAATAIYNHLNSLVPYDTPTSYSRSIFVGNPEEVARHIETWFETGATDGFDILPAFVPGAIEAFSALVVPLLQQRGIFRRDYEKASLRDHLHLKRPRSTFAQPELSAL